MKRLIFIILFIYPISNHLFAQQKINADLKIINFLGKSPYKNQRNALTESLLSILYYNPQPNNFPKIGFIDTKGKLKIKPIYSMASDFYDGYANIIKDSLYGYIDKKGNEVLFKQFQYIYFYYGNTGIAKKNEHYGLVDRNGNPLTEFKYNMISFFGFDNFVGTISSGKNHLLNNKGDVIFNKDFEYKICSSFFENDSSIVVSKSSDKNYLEGIVNLKNEILVNLTYKNIYFIGDKDLVLVKKDNRYGFINKQGKEEIPLVYEQAAFQITENLICVKQNGKWGFINKKNEIIIPFEYDEALPFFNEKAFVKKENFFGVIGKNNNKIIDFKLERVELPFFTNNLSVFKKGNKYGYINEKGTMIIDNIYDFSNPFVNDIGYVELNGKAGYLNKKGKEIIPIIYNQLWLPSEGLIRFTN